MLEFGFEGFVLLWDQMIYENFGVWGGYSEEKTSFLVGYLSLSKP